MKIFEKEIFFDGIFVTFYENSGHGSYGSGYCKNQEKYNRKRIRIKFLGFTILKYTIEHEYVPPHVWISMSTFGYDASGWMSKWANHPNFKSSHI